MNGAIGRNGELTANRRVRLGSDPGPLRFRSRRYAGRASSIRKSRRRTATHPNVVGVSPPHPASADGGRFDASTDDPEGPPANDPTGTADLGAARDAYYDAAGETVANNGIADAADHSPSGSEGDIHIAEFADGDVGIGCEPGRSRRARASGISPHDPATDLATDNVVSMLAVLERAGVLTPELAEAIVGNVVPGIDASELQDPFAPGASPVA